MPARPHSVQVNYRQLIAEYRRSGQMRVRKPSRISWKGSTCTVSLNSGHHAIIDSDDIHAVIGLNWFTSRGYAIAALQYQGTRYIIPMHRVITSAPRGLDVDHLNHIRLDNRKKNLRCVTHAINSRSIQKRQTPCSSRFMGVSLHPNGFWAARITRNYKTHFLGYYATQEEAANAYTKAA